MSDSLLDAGSDFDASGKGAMGSEPGTEPATPEGPAGSEDGQPAPDDDGGTTGLDAGSPDGKLAATPAATPEFFDPQILVDKPDLKPAYNSMQKAFTKKTMKLAADQKNIDAYKSFETQFANDPAGTLDRLAQSQGLQVIRPGASSDDKPKPFTDGWQPGNWKEVAEGLMAQVESRINQAVNPIKGGLASIENSTFETTLDNLAPEWREYEQDVADTLTMAPGLMKDPAKLLRASLPQKVIEGRAMQAALARMKSQSASGHVGGSSTTTTRPENEPQGKLTFAEAAVAAKKDLGIE
ncbi:MAG: hypothetical protein JRD68_00030 [Deltaproteobacteria bacterium]|nr:hypothetical protein [Deltaproteobacteria bacterium]